MTPLSSESTGVSGVSSAAQQRAGIKTDDGSPQLFLGLTYNGNTGRLSFEAIEGCNLYIGMFGDFFLSYKKMLVANTHRRKHATE